MGPCGSEAKFDGGSDAVKIRSKRSGFFYLFKIEAEIRLFQFSPKMHEMAIKARLGTLRIFLSEKSC